MDREIKIAFSSEKNNMGVAKAVEMLSKAINQAFPEGKIFLHTEEGEKVQYDPVSWKIVDYPEDLREGSRWGVSVGYAPHNYHHIDAYGYLGVDFAKEGHDRSVRLVVETKQPESIGIQIMHIDEIKPRDFDDLLVAEVGGHKRRHHLVGVCGMDFSLISSMKPLMEQIIEERGKREYPEFEIPTIDFPFYPEQPKRYHQISFNRSVKFPKNKKYKTHKRHEKGKHRGRREGRNWQR